MQIHSQYLRIEIYLFPPLVQFLPLFLVPIELHSKLPTLASTPLFSPSKIWVPSPLHSSPHHHFLQMLLPTWWTTPPPMAVLESLRHWLIWFDLKVWFFPSKPTNTLTRRFLWIGGFLPSRFRVAWGACCRLHFFFFFFFLRWIDWKLNLPVRGGLGCLISCLVLGCYTWFLYRVIFHSLRKLCHR